ncbi:hypothetical protein [Prosthecochloris sp.]|uniref:hypothetical protein n=1 Tax=Prosthecochloris sp. TaxID=290513 RepID=UPI0025F51F59|nr:hypothetical protein [Prosthecochloris sp.]
MAHVRTQIRDRVITTLSGLTTTGSRVYRSRVYPMSSATMPGICVYCMDEKGQDETEDLLTKSVSVVVDGYVSGDDFDDDVDTIQAEVETALYGDYNSSTDRFFNGLVLDLSFTAADSKYNGEAKIKHGIIRMVFTALYLINRGAPETAL